MPFLRGCVRASALASLLVVSMNACSFDWNKEQSAASASASGSGGAGPSGACPTAEPTKDAPCDDNLRCEYGDDPRPDCRRVFQCSVDAWSDITKCKDCTAPEPCPVPDPSCAAPVTCANPDGSICGCHDEQFGCGPQPSPNCPAAAPNFGAACSAEGLECDYGQCAYWTSIQRTCSEGIWLDTTMPCGEPLECE